MAKKRRSQREIGFAEGIAYAAGLIAAQGGHIDAEMLLNESGLSGEDFSHCQRGDLDLIREAHPEIELPRGK